MLKAKPVLLFLIKATVIYALLAAPFSFYNTLYGVFYRATAKVFFDKINHTGFVLFSEGRENYITHFNLGNDALVKPDKTTDTVYDDVNIRYRGYLPLVLLIALVLASPVAGKRKAYGLLIGAVAVTLIVMLKQWLHILYLCGHNPWLMLYNLSEGQKKTIDFIYSNYVSTLPPTLFLVVAIWILITFRRDDLKLLIMESPSK
ncbi:MAG: hypothetical protein ABI723_00015 [Bacteroidia bacterium]